ncbi:hypothetical protein CI102_12026 [Trichoderma harzianum]|nr:hypothetical protein CI102_12026 [Trichoderma harzianum]
MPVWAVKSNAIRKGISLRGKMRGPTALSSSLWTLHTHPHLPFLAIACSFFTLVPPEYGLGAPKRLPSLQGEVTENLFRSIVHLESRASRQSRRLLPKHCRSSLGRHNLSIGVWVICLHA